MAAGRVTDAIEGLESILGLSFTDKHVLLESLLTPGCGIARAGARSCPDGNKRLAVLGDTVLKLLVITDHYDTGAPRRVIDDHVQRVANNRNLERKGFELGIDKYVFGNPSQRGVINPRVMQDTVEAIIGAAYIDGGEVVARKVMVVLGLE